MLSLRILQVEWPSGVKARLGNELTPTQVYVATQNPLYSILASKDLCTSVLYAVLFEEITRMGISS